MTRKSGEIDYNESINQRKEESRMLQKEIRRLRIAKGWTQEQLAEKVHITRHALNQYERGKRSVTLDMYENILKALEVSIKYQVPDINMHIKALSSYFFETWQTLEEKFPEWKVDHTGGHVFILRKDIITKDGRPVQISVADTGAILHKKLVVDATAPYGVKAIEGVYASKEEFEAESNLYWEFEDIAQEIIFMIGDGAYQHYPIAEELFDEVTLDEAEYHADLLMPTS